MEISIVIPTLNEQVLLPNLLKDLQDQTFRDFEIIVADAGSKDQTVEIAHSLGAKVIPGGMPAVGRNKGAQAANGSFLVFLDADTRVSPTFLAEVRDELENRFLDLATCEVVPLSENTIDSLLHEFANLAIKLGQFTDPHAPGFCIIISKRLFNRIGGFKEDLKLAEDHDLVKRASQFRPLRVLNAPRVQVSVRRLEKEGRVKLISKYRAVELYRILFGSDMGPYPEAYRVIYRFLETDDEYFNYNTGEVPMQGRWHVHGLYLPDEVLRKVYFENAERILLNYG